MAQMTDESRCGSWIANVDENQREKKTNSDHGNSRIKKHSKNNFLIALWA